LSFSKFTKMGFHWKLHAEPQTVGVWEPVAWLAPNDFEIQAQVLKCHDRFYWTIDDQNSGFIEDTNHEGGIAAASEAVVEEVEKRIKRAEQTLRGSHDPDDPDPFENY